MRSGPASGRIQQPQPPGHSVRRQHRPAGHNPQQHRRHLQPEPTSDAPATRQPSGHRGRRDPRQTAATHKQPPGGLLQMMQRTRKTPRPRTPPLPGIRRMPRLQLAGTLHTRLPGHLRSLQKARPHLRLRGRIGRGRTTEDRRRPSNDATGAEPTNHRDEPQEQGEQNKIRNAQSRGNRSPTRVQRTPNTTTENKALRLVLHMLGTAQRHHKSHETLGR